MDTSEDPKVDILECGGNVTDESQEEEEEEEEGLSRQSSSSSFGDSMCARDDDYEDDDNDFEAESMLNKDYPLPDTFGDGAELLGLRKKKKLTDEWRKFCQPLMWRCKWLELKAKEIECQARGYDREVRSYYQSKQFDLEKSGEGVDGESQRMDVYKRGRRRRVEETTDVAAYISNHNVFSYSEKRKPTTFKAQCPVPGFGTGRKATVKEEEQEVEDDDCFVSESDRSDDILGEILCKIDEAQDKAKRLKKRVDQLLCESQATATIAPSRRDFRVQNGKQHALVEEEEPSLPHIQREGTVQIGRQRISADHHTEDLSMIPQAPPPPFESDGQFLYNISPLPYGGLGFPTIEDLLMDGSELNDYEAEPELDDCFRKLMNEFGKDTMSEEADDDDEEEEEEDPTPATKRHKTSH